MNRGELRTEVRRILKDLKSPFKWRSNLLNDRINIHHRKFAEMTGVLTKFITFSTVQYQRKYTLPTDFLDIDRKWGVTFDGERIEPMDVKLEDVENRLWRKQAPGIPGRNAGFWEGYYITEDGLSLALSPTPNADADITTLSAAVSDTTGTTINVTSDSDFEKSGDIIIDSEVMHYENKDSNQLLVASRGAEGTTAATHSNGATVTKRDLGLTYVYRPDELDSDDDEPFNALVQYRNFHIGIVHAVAAMCLAEIPKKLELSAVQRQLAEREQARLELKRSRPIHNFQSIKVHPAYLRRGKGLAPRGRRHH